MDGNAVKAVVVTLVVGLAAFVAFPTKRQVVGYGERWARTWRVIVPGELVPAFDRRTRLNRRLVGLAVLLCAVAVAAGLFDGPSPGPFLVALLLTLAPLLVWRAARGMPAVPAIGDARVARAHATTFGDYLPWWSLLVVLASAVGPMICLTLRDRPDWGSGEVFLAVVLQAVVGGLSALLLLRVVRASLPAADLPQLYLQDADRASSMCHVVSLCAWSSFVLLQQIELGAQVILTGHVFGDVLVQFSPLIASGLVQSAASRRFRKRLWKGATALDVAAWAPDAVDVGGAT